MIDLFLRLHSIDWFEISGLPTLVNRGLQRPVKPKSRSSPFLARCASNSCFCWTAPRAQGRERLSHLVPAPACHVNRTKGMAGHCQASLLLHESRPDRSSGSSCTSTSERSRGTVLHTIHWFAAGKKGGKVGVKSGARRYLYVKRLAADEPAVASRLGRCSVSQCCSPPSLHQKTSVIDRQQRSPTRRHAPSVPS